MWIRGKAPMVGEIVIGYIQCQDCLPVITKIGNGFTISSRNTTVHVHEFKTKISIVRYSVEYDKNGDETEGRYWELMEFFPRRLDESCPVIAWMPLPKEPDDVD